MTTPDLLSYIKEAATLGQSDEQTRALLKESGWSDEDISEGFAQVKGTPTPAAQAPQPAQPVMRAQTSAAPLSEFEHSVGTSPAQQPQPVTTAAAQPAQKRSGGGKALVVILALLILLGAGGGAFAYYWMHRETADQILLEAVQNQMQTKTGKSDATITIAADGLPPIFGTTSSSGGLSGKITMEVKGVFDNTDKSSPKVDATEDVSAQGGGFSVGFGLGIRSIGPTTYLEATSVSGILALFAAGIPTNKWYSIDLSTATSTIESVLPSQAQNVLKDASSSLAQTPNAASMARAQKELGDLFIKDRVITVKQAKHDETIGQTPSYHYVLAIDKTALKQYATAAMGILKKDVPGVFPSAKNYADAQKQLTETLDDFFKNGALHAEIWIGKKDRYVTRLLLKSTYATAASSSTASSSVPSAGSTSHTTFSADILLSGQNQPVTIAAPTDATPLVDLLGKFFSASSTNKSTSIHIGF